MPGLTKDMLILLRAGGFSDDMLFYDHVPDTADSPDTMVTLIQRAGIPPLRTQGTETIFRPVVEVISRAVDISTAFTNAESAYEIFDRIYNEQITPSTRILSCSPIGAPTAVGKDESRSRHLVVFDVAVMHSD
jgi:hypothetical protein